MKPDELAAGLHQVHTQLAVLTSTIQSQREGLARVESDLSDMIGRHEKILMGNGSVGVVTKVDRLEQSDEKRGRNFWLVWGALVAVGVKFVVDAVTK